MGIGRGVVFGNIIFFLKWVAIFFSFVCIDDVRLLFEGFVFRFLEGKVGRLV